VRVKELKKGTHMDADAPPVFQSSPKEIIYTKNIQLSEKKSSHSFIVER
jgi:hypothetical protein